jgi:hypothetical protein
MIVVNREWNGEEVKRRAEALAGKSSFEIGLIVQGYAKELVPRISGRLGGSITTASGSGQKTQPEGAGAVGTDTIKPPSDPFETFVGTPVEYGPYKEFGTFKTDAKPFLRPALALAQGKAVSIVQVGAKKEFGDYLNPKGVMSFEESVKAQT